MRQPRPSDPVLTGCLETLRGLGGSIHIDFTPGSRDSADDGQLEVVLPHARVREKFAVAITRTHLSYALAAGLIARHKRAANRLLFAPYVPAKLGGELTAAQLSYVDAVGNCHVTVGRDQHLLAHIEGRKPLRSTGARTAGRAPSHQLAFALLAHPALLDAPIRDIALAAGVGKTAVAENLKRLTEQGFIVRSKAGATLVRRRELLDRWIAAYADVLRPHALIGTYRTQVAEPEALEQHIEKVWADRQWALGGGAAAWRMSHYYRGSATVVHVDAPPSADALRELRAIPARDGSLTLLRTTGKIAYEGVGPHLAHPLLVYAEMAVSIDSRMTEAAHELRERFVSEGT